MYKMYRPARLLAPRKREHVLNQDVAHYEVQIKGKKKTRKFCFLTQKRSKASLKTIPGTNFFSSVQTKRNESGN